MFSRRRREFSLFSVAPRFAEFHDVSLGAEWIESRGRTERSTQSNLVETSFVLSFRLLPAIFHLLGASAYSTTFPFIFFYFILFSDTRVFWGGLFPILVGCRTSAHSFLSGRAGANAELEPTTDGHQEESEGVETSFATPPSVRICRPFADLLGGATLNHPLMIAFAPPFLPFIRALLRSGARMKSPGSNRPSFPLASLGPVPSLPLRSFSSFDLFLFLLYSSSFFIFSYLRFFFFFFL